MQSNQLQSHINRKWLANKIFRLSKRDCNDDIFYLYWTQSQGKDWMSNLLYFAKWHIFCSAKITCRIKTYDFCVHFWNRSEISARYFVFSIWTCNIVYESRKAYLNNYNCIRITLSTFSSIQVSEIIVSLDEYTSKKEIHKYVT